MQTTAIDDVWGIGRQYAKLLNGIGVKTAFDFAQFDPTWIKKKMGVVVQRVQEELQGTSCIPMETMMQPKKNIATTRSFGTRLSDINLIGEAVSTHAVGCAKKLRKQKSVANHVTVFIHTNPFSETENYISRSLTVTLPVASNSNVEIAKAALCALKNIHQQGVLYKKTGVIVSGLSNQTFVQGNLFEGGNNENFKQLSKVTDVLNNRFGRDAVKLAVQGNSKEWQLKNENLSHRYTTRWDELLKVKA